jgi:hypothetical protein
MAGLARALKTDIMADLDLKGLAQILKSRGRKGDTILAHISPAEAKLLKKRGGSGKSNPETGLPEFALEGNPDSVAPPVYVPPTTGTEGGGSAPAPVEVNQSFQQGGQYPESSAQSAYPPEAYTSQYPPPNSGYAPPAVSPSFQPGPGLTDAQALAAYQNAPNVPAQDKGTEEKSWWGRTQDSALKALQDPSNLLKLGLGVGGIGMGLQQTAEARKQAADAQAQYAKLGQPFQAQGNEMMRAAQAGELSPQSRQAFQAAQAQSAQQTANQGGVGQQQAATQLGSFYSKLLENQNTLGMSLVQVGDTYAAQGIQAGLKANQELQAMTANYYSTLARMLVPSMAGTATPTRPPQ